MISVDRQFLRQTLVDLVRIDSRNPLLVKGGAGDVAISTCLADVMTSIGLDVTVYKLSETQMNVVGVLHGTGGGKSLMLNGHVDTVGVEGMDDPFSAEIRTVNGRSRLYGRGSQDMKGSLAAMIACAKAIIDAGIELAGDLVIACVADEEYMSIGSDDLVKQHVTDAAIVTEPTDLQLCRAHRGFVWYEVETFGRAAHGSRFKEGIDAIMHIGRFLGKLDILEQELRQRPPHPLVGPPSLHASVISGGTEVSVYPAHCKLEVERRTSPNETTAQATAELRSILDELSIDPLFKASLRTVFDRAAFEISADASIVRTLDHAITQRLGNSPPHIGATFWTDAAILAEAGIETVLLGPVGAGLHSAEEWVELQSCIDLAHILATTTTHYCKQK